MVSTTIESNPNSNHKQNPCSKKPKNVYPIGGIQVEFPYQPYGTQLAFMCRVISTLDRAQREGRCHALLESPTGTGKSLSLLCSVLAWQQSYKSKIQNANLSHSKAAPEAVTDPLNHGGGFIPETQPSSVPPAGNPEPAQVVSNKRPKIPTVYYSSRTHSQISQVIREYRKTSYRVPMAVLASRKHYCTNRYVRGKENLDEECKLLLKDKKNVQCPEFKNANKVVAHPSLQRGGYNEVHDIEDLVKLGKVVKGCPYYAARSMSDHAQLVFCPYSYIINPVIRGAMEVDVKGAVLIFDEAHNMEEIARDAGSFDIEEDSLCKLQTELEQMSLVEPMIYQPLCEVIEGLISWIESKKDSLQKREFQHYFSSWTGDNALRELQGSNITQQCYPILLECATKAIRASKEAETDPSMTHLSGMSILTLEELFASLTYFFSRNGSHLLDFQLGLRRRIKRDTRNAFGTWTHTVSLWCLNPAVVFKDIADLSLSIILTSGTLSPMNSFSSELGMQFGTCLEAPHVIDVASQVWAAAISTGPGNYPLNASYKTADAFEFQDALGKTLEEICKIVPGGSLVFFPSYKLMEKLCTRWGETGQWSRLSLRKSLFVEPRGGNQEEFEPVLKGYYEAICGRGKPTAGKKGTTKKKTVETTENHEDAKKGAAFLAVCRGKVSEGIDFADDNARAVIIVGIPYPNMYDIQVELKKKYNDMYKTSKNLLGGNEWYCHQAFRALNQAAGRCIRHRFDYGAIILLDERYKQERNRTYISKWLRQSIKQYEDFDTSLEGLRSFFKDVKERVNSKMVGVPNCTVEDNLPPKNESKELPSKKNQKRNKTSRPGRKDQVGRQAADMEDCIILEANNSYANGTSDLLKQKDQKVINPEDATLKQVSILSYGAPNFKNQSQGDFPVLGSVLAEVIETNKKANPGFSSRADSGWCETSSMTLCDEDLGTTIVNETPDSSPCSFSRNRKPTSTVVHASGDSPDQSLRRHEYTTKLGKVSPQAESSIVTSPDRDFICNTSNLMPEAESSISASINSHASKRRKSSISQYIDLVKEENSKVLTTQPPDRLSFTRRIEFGFESSCAERPQNLTVPEAIEENNSVPSFGSTMDQKLRISCSLCRNPLGLPENQQYAKCWITSSSKTHLLSLHRERLDSNGTSMPTSVLVLMTDCSSVNQQLRSTTMENAEGQGVWCEEDGCVFKSIFCPFCAIPDNCLGVQVMATDSSNLKFLNKILFYYDSLDTGPSAVTEDKVPKHKDLLGVRTPVTDKNDVFKTIDGFSYSPSQQDSGGWRTTKSKLKLPKRG